MPTGVTQTAVTRGLGAPVLADDGRRVSGAGSRGTSCAGAWSVTLPSTSSNSSAGPLARIRWAPASTIRCPARRPQAGRRSPRGTCRGRRVDGGGRSDGRRPGDDRCGWADGCGRWADGRLGRTGRRAAERRRPAPNGPRGWGHAHRLGLLAQPGDAPGRHPLVLEPGGAVAVRRARGRAVAGRRRAHDDGRGRLREGAASDGPVAVAQPGPGRVRRRHRRAGGLVGDRPLPVAGLQGDRPHYRLGRGGGTAPAGCG